MRSTIGMAPMRASAKKPIRVQPTPSGSLESPAALTLPARMSISPRTFMSLPSQTSPPARSPSPVTPISSSIRPAAIFNSPAAPPSKLACESFTAMRPPKPMMSRTSLVTITTSLAASTVIAVCAEGVFPTLSWACALERAKARLANMRKISFIPLLLFQLHTRLMS